MKGNIIITVLGNDKTGIVANVSKRLHELNVNIIDITQTIFENDLFAMIVLADAKGNENEFDFIQKEILSLEEELGMKVFVQHEEIFKVMHRV